MALNQGKLLLTENAPSSGTKARLQVEENVAYNGAVPTKAFVVRTDHSANWAYGIVADVNKDKTFALKVIHRDFNGPGQSQETFGVYGDGQTIISTKTPDFNTTGAEPAFLIQDATITNGSNNVFFKVFKSGKTIIGDKTTWNVHNNALLSVDGKITCREAVITQQTWADFVFDKNYQLIPLNDLEAFYKSNHHLPNIPSACEVEENGNDLGKTDALLLQKIEELTLYLVDQNKLMQEQKKKISDLEKKVTELEATR